MDFRTADAGLWSAAADPVVNPSARDWVGGPLADCRAFHRRLPDYEPTPLRVVPELASRFGVGTVAVKDESHRFGLPAFKILGASWGVYRALCERLGTEPTWRALPDLLAALAPLAGVRLLAATAGNHGWAVARVGRWLGLPVLVLLPAATGAATAAAIEREGAEVRILDVSYDTIVATAAGMALQDRRNVLVQDTAWPGYEQVPGWIVEGYSTLFHEIDAQLATLDLPGADLVAIPAGVGSLLSAAIGHYRAAQSPSRPALLAVEPVDAACVAASLRAGQRVSVPTRTSVMAGLNAGTVTAAGWPLIRAGLDAAVTVTDEAALAESAALAGYGIDSGPCGAASLAGLAVVASVAKTDPLAAAVRLSTSSTVVLLSTEGSGEVTAAEADS